MQHPCVQHPTLCPNSTPFVTHGQGSFGAVRNPTLRPHITATPPNSVLQPASAHYNTDYIAVHYGLSHGYYEPVGNSALVMQQAFYGANASEVVPLQQPFTPVVGTEIIHYN